MFCKNCGEQIDENSKYCNNCGAQIIKDKKENSHYDGKIKKCPSCGASINAYETRCNSCGYEFRETEVSKSLDEFSRKIASINEIKYKRPDISLSEITDMKVTFIGSFVIPNNKEDILEFMILASSNLKTYDMTTKDYKKIAAINQAWWTKMEQAYEKAKLALKNEPEFTYIETIYQSKKKEINKLELKIVRKKLFWPIYFGIASLLSIIGWIYESIFKTGINDDLVGSIGLCMLSIGACVFMVKWISNPNSFGIFCSGDAEFGE